MSEEKGCKNASTGDTARKSPLALARASATYLRPPSFVQSWCSVAPRTPSSPSESSRVIVVSIRYPVLLAIKRAFQTLHALVNKLFSRFFGVVDVVADGVHDTLSEFRRERAILEITVSTDRYLCRARE